MCVRAQTCTMTALLFASELSCSFYIVLLLGFLPLSRPRLLLSLSRSVAERASVRVVLYVVLLLACRF